jgi:hypothetical protein
MTAIARLKREAADTNLLNILKRKRAETDLVREEALLENASQRIADEIDTLENDYQREQAELAQKTLPSSSGRLRPSRGRSLMLPRRNAQRPVRHPPPYPRFRTAA